MVISFDDSHRLKSKVSLPAYDLSLTSYLIFNQLNIQVLYSQRICFNELTPWINLVTHQCSEQLI